MVRKATNTEELSLALVRGEAAALEEVLNSSSILIYARDKYELEEQNLISGSHLISTAQRFWRHKLFGSCGHKIVRDQVIKKSESCQKLCKGWSQLREQASIFSEKLQLSICTLPFRFAPCRTHCCEKVLILRNEVIGKRWTRTFQT